jgi:hypothetical protein
MPSKPNDHLMLVMGDQRFCPMMPCYISSDVSTLVIGACCIALLKQEMTKKIVTNA